jgi:hypothetical protein
MSELRAGIPFAGAELTIVPIEVVCRDCSVETRSFSVSAFVEPVAIVLLNSFGVRALDASGAELDADLLAAKVPGLREILDSWQRGS